MKWLALALLIACSGDKPDDTTKTKIAAPTRGPQVVWEGQIFHCSRANDCRGTIGATLEIQGTQDRTLVTIGREPPVTTTVAGASIPLTIGSFADVAPSAIAAAVGVTKLPLAITTGDTVLYTTGAPVPMQAAAAIVDAAFAGAHVTQLPAATGTAIWIAASAWGGAAVGVVGTAARLSDVDRVIVRPDEAACAIALLDRTTGATRATAPVCTREAIVAWAKTM